MPSSDLEATIFIPTYRGARYIEDLVRSVFAQTYDRDFEVLVYDTDSGDESPAILQRLADEFGDRFRWKSVAKKEFSHGRTRAAAALDAHGEFVAFLTQDATPANGRWLYELLKPFELNERIVAVLGKQQPRPDAIPMLKSEIELVFAGFGPDLGTILFYKDDFVDSQGAYDVVSFYSDVNSAARRSFLVEQVNYRDVPYAEDQLFGRDVIDAGYIKAYAPRANVLHSNEIPLADYKHRMFDETLGLRQVGVPVQMPSVKVVARMIVGGVVRDAKKIMRDPSYSTKRKLYWLAMNPLFHLERWRGVRLAADAPLDDESVRDEFSLERRQTREDQAR
jgi:rhamnosyltransferase